MKSENTNSCLSFVEKGEFKTVTDNVKNMGKKDRKQLVLEFMAEHPIPMPPLVWYRSLRAKRRVTFGIDSLRTYLDEFVDDGLVVQINKEALDDGKLEIIEDSQYRAYYMITDKGIDSVTENSHTSVTGTKDNQ